MAQNTRQRVVAFVAYGWAWLGARVLRVRKWLDAFIGPIASEDELVQALSAEHERAEAWKQRYQSLLKWTSSVDSFWHSQYETLKAGNASTLAWQDVQIAGLAESLRNALAERDGLAARLRETTNELATATLREANLLAGETIPGPAGLRLPLSTWSDAEEALRSGVVTPDDIMQADIN